MSTQPNDGGPAFPWRHMDCDSMGQEVTREQGEGMTVRDYFAAAALTGFLAGRNINALDASFYTAKKAAESCYGYADAMLAARDGKEQA
jgi:hypothetical protein